MHLAVEVEMVGTCGPAGGRIGASTPAKMFDYREWCADNDEDSAYDADDDAYGRPFPRRARTRVVASLSLSRLRRLGTFSEPRSPKKLLLISH